MSNSEWWGLLIGFLFLCLIIWGVSGAVERRNAMMTECLEDGRKRYECHGILRGRR